MKVPDIRVTPPGPNARKVVARDARWMATTTKANPLVVKRARGSVIEDVDGNMFVDYHASGRGRRGLCVRFHAPLGSITQLEQVIRLTLTAILGG